MAINFDKVIDRRNTHSAKWDAMQAVYGVSPKDGIAMWVADMDFESPKAVNDALHAAADHGVHGYFGDDSSYKSAITGWMARRHGWHVDPDWISTTHGLVAAVALCLQAFTQKGDGVILFTPVYHAFARAIEANNRVVVESQMKQVNGRYEMDIAAAQSKLTGNEKMVILCSPHNPGGRVWSADELREVADFCTRNDLILISDEVHHDLVFAPHKHVPMPIAAPNVRDRLIMLVAASKTFNIAGGMNGIAIIENPKMRTKLARAMAAAASSPNRFGKAMTQAAYNHGEEWLAALLEYLNENRQIFDAGVNRIPGLKSMALESTYLAWVDFSDTGMTRDEFTRRVEIDARIAANHGPTFGSGGEGFLRFNLGCRKEVVIDAVSRLNAAFADLQ